jgi:hypothetical protein
VDANGQPLSTESNAESRAPFLPGIYGTEGIYLDNSFTSAYHSVQLEVNKRFSRGLQFTSSYTLGKSIDSSSTTTLGGCLSNPFDVRSDRGRSDWDRRHGFVFSGVWAPPVLSDQRGLLGRLLGGWTASGFQTVQSGAPVTPTSGQNTALDGNICGGSSIHPDQVGQIERDHSSRHDMVMNFFNRDAFALPGIGRYGSAGRNIFSGPALVSTDLAILKDFRVTELHRLQFRAEFFNLFNQVNFNNPVANLSSATYGRITGAQAGRAIQFGLKYLW